ncbi:hypothetical protein F5148DRAFT_567946 [Russula earlei]|uniref:Uncharacterized protein n=1 Tax=Russula earlei TaxID=71964 RepID=A0ACC0TXE7_9AGAM|nr:hypothetical protein F5148DRAFT_567946 [Russula earlei]
MGVSRAYMVRSGHQTLTVSLSFWWVFERAPSTVRCTRPFARQKGAILAAFDKSLAQSWAATARFVWRHTPMFMKGQHSACTIAFYDRVRGENNLFATAWRCDSSSPLLASTLTLCPPSHPPHPSLDVHDVSTPRMYATIRGHSRDDRFVRPRH